MTGKEKNVHSHVDHKMEAFKITGNWSKQSQVLKEKFNQLTESDLKLETGKEEELLKRIETRLNKKREEVINIINKCKV